MKLRGKNPLDVPPLTASAVAANEEFFTRLWDRELAGAVPSPSPASWWASMIKRHGYGVAAVPRDQERVLQEWFSLPLDGWGVVLQKQGRLREARARFEQALELKTNNFSALISLACNTNLQAGAKLNLVNVPLSARWLVEKLGSLDGLNRTLDLGGPFDDPTFGYLLGTIFFDHGLLVQAAEQLERVRTLAPDSLAPGLALAEVYNRLQMPDRSRPLVTQMREVIRHAPPNSGLDLDLALLESYAWLLQTNRANALEALQSVIKQHPGDPQVANRVVSAYLALSDVTNALQLLDERLAKAPEDGPTLNSKALILLQSGQVAAALPILDHLLAITNQLSVRINHAFARIATQDFAGAKSEFGELEKRGVAASETDYGLGLVAAHDHDTNLAAHYFQLCLSNTPTGAPLWQQASDRLAILQPVQAAR
jgi:Flp pilus assembly protein TadD